jgi:hypothetical protein
MDIDLLSLSTSPSDHECKDGDLSGMLNVVREDGALHAIPQPVTVAGIKASGYFDLATTKFYIHKVDNDDVSQDDHTNWFAIATPKTGSEQVWWCDDISSDNQTWNEITDLDDFKVNAISFTGRIVSLVGDTETRWLQWDGTTYNAYCLDDFEFGIQIHSANEGTKTFTSVFTDIVMQNYIGSDGLPLTDNDPMTKIYGLSKTGMDYFMERLDAEVNASIEAGDSLHKYKSFGFCALRMYDGSYIRISDIFYLGQKDSTSRMHYTDLATADYSVSFTTDLHSHTIRANIPNLENIRNLILGIDVFLCAPSMYYKTGQAHKFNRTVYGSERRATNVQFQPYSTVELYDLIDKQSFHRVLRIDTADISTSIGSATAIVIPAYDETGSVLTLEDFHKSHYGAKVAHNYNRRLNIGDATNTITFKPMGKVNYTWDDSYLDVGGDTSCGGLMWNGYCFPIYSKDTSLANARRFCQVTVYFEIKYSDDSQHKTVYAKSKTELPMPPIFMLPYANIESVDMYVGLVESSSDGWPDDYRSKYWKKVDVQFHTSTTGNWSYVVTKKAKGAINGNLSLLSPIWFTGTEVAVTNDFVESTRDNYNSAAQDYDRGAHELSVRYRNRIFSSESNNPFLFKATNQVVVGNGTVLALNAPTQPISEGQAGSTPLVAFTTEGIYPLYVDSSTGLFSATQPGPRDVIIKGDDGYNTEAVTAIDNAILFPTDRGLMMYSGSQTTCLTDTLAGTVNDVELPRLYDIMQTEDFEDTGDKISYYGLGEKLHTFLKTCRIAYDYTSQRIMVYAPQTDSVPNKALVYSLKSGAWGMAESNLRQAVNAYPQALCISTLKRSSSDIGTVVDLYNPSPEGNNFYVITRPIGFGAPHTLKRVSLSIIRGLFTQGSVKCAVYGSRDLKNWYLLNSSINHYLRGRFGAPYKYYRYVILGTLLDGETVQGISAQVTESLNNKLR